MGTPERPLSDLALRAYLSFWTAVLLARLDMLFRRRPLRPTLPRRDIAERRRRSNGRDAPDRGQRQPTAKPRRGGATTLAHPHSAVQAARRLQRLDLPPSRIRRNAAASSRSGSDRLPRQHRRLASAQASAQRWAGSTPRSPRPRSAADGEARRSSRASAGSHAVHPALDLSNSNVDE